MTQKFETTNDENSNPSTFLTTLYGSTQDNLYLELRCIHPENGVVKRLWAQIDDEKQRQNMLQAAMRHNADGYGVYFAPCLRSEKKGTAEAAVLLPALWIDIDSTPDCREADLEKIKAFDPAPSIIVSSGGGWHGYWLLDMPLKLDGTIKEDVAHTLNGLFSALGGDPGYVKSVASMMCLPGSVNTKPDRDNAEVQIITWHPDRRYKFSDFAWLKVKTQHKVERIGNLAVITLNPDTPLLPARTERYLASGATNGNRNHELFAAACQMRDAGYSQSDAERDLIQRHIADGDSSENTTQREKEAKATIASAFSQPPREPIQSRQQVAQKQVSQLLDRYEVNQKTVERPSTAEIIEAVEACAHLNAVEWAEQREKFKSLTGDGLKISDIDTLYREKRKVIERQQQQEYVDTESYLLLNGKMIYRKETYRGTHEKTVADWSATALYQTCQVDDDGKEVHVTTVELQRGSSSKKLEVPGEVFVDDLALRRFIGANAGAQYVVRAGMSKHLVPAIVQLSGEFPTHRHYNFMGWKQIDDKWVYVSPGDCITAKGKLAEKPSVELDQRLRDYGLQAVSWDESLQAFEAVTKVLPSNLAPTLIAFALLPVIQRFFPSAATRPAIHLVGTSGSGKSEIASLLSSFYGQFGRDTPPAQWGDTINTVEVLGYPLADALYWVDDYKDIYADPRTFTRFLQSYSRNLGRGRLTREAKVRHSKPCRGMILSTGETSLEGEISVSSRMMSLEIPPWKQRDPHGQALREAESLRDKLPGFTAHFASWVAQRLEDGGFQEEITSRFLDNLRGYNQKVGVTAKGVHDRVVKNWSMLLTTYQLLSHFVYIKDDAYLLPTWEDTVEASIASVRQERASEVFLNILGQILGSGQAVIDDDMRNPREYPPGVTVVGYRHEGFIYLIPNIALREVNKIQPLKFSALAIGNQLKEVGALIPGKSNLTVQRSVRGGVIRLWRLKGDVMGCEDCEGCEDA